MVLPSRCVMRPGRSYRRSRDGGQCNSLSQFCGVSEGQALGHNVAFCRVSGGFFYHCYPCMASRARKSGFKHTDVLVDRIIRLTVHTGLLTSVCAMLDLIFYLADPSGLHLMFNFPLCKLYTNSLISSLNCRSGWGFTPEYGGSSGDGTSSSEGSTAVLLPKPVPPPPQPRAAVMDRMKSQSTDIDRRNSATCIDDTKLRPSMAKQNSADSDSTAVAASRKGNVASKEDVVDSQSRAYSKATVVGEDAV
ncbi:hypothetical protein B0H10DRAFT_1107053 [Mycena sp. CBHHK59/15]|nr:hypothetical protein B0H10DRAFT_1107053 [Mycena sp. CBHHK59/15]